MLQLVLLPLDFQDPMAQDALNPAPHHGVPAFSFSQLMQIMPTIFTWLQEGLFGAGVGTGSLGYWQ